MSNSLKTTFEFLFLGREENSFIENYVYDLGDSYVNGGKLFLSFELGGNLKDAQMIGDLIFDSIRSVFFSDFKIDAYVRFEDALKEANRALNALKQEKGVSDLGRMVSGSLNRVVVNLKDGIEMELSSKVGLILVEARYAEFDHKKEEIHAIPILHEEKVVQVADGGKGVEITERLKSLNVEKYKKSAKLVVKKVVGVIKAFGSERVDLQGGKEIGGRRDKGIGSWSKDKLIVAIVCLCLVLLFGIWWIKDKAETDARINSMAQQLLEIKENINTAVTNGQFDKAYAAELLNDAQAKALEIYN